MKTNVHTGNLMILSALYIIGCRDPYIPPEIPPEAHYLVVSGFLNTADTTYIILSRTRGLYDTIPNIPENNAAVAVIGSLGDVTYLTWKGDGIYQADYLNLNQNETYQLQILTSGGNKYLSDSISVSSTPPIDSLNWKQDSTGPSSKLGVTIYANTHDPSTPYGYYRWDFVETWQYQATYESYYYYDVNNRILVPRLPQDQVYNCWQSLLSNSLIVASTFQLSENLISEQPIQFIPAGNQRLSVKYSILVKQYAISQDAFDYWVNLKKTTELTGSIFDPLPSQVSGNIHNVSNVHEPVLGFISASAATEERLFISSREVSHWGYEFKGCEEFVLSPDQFDDYFGTRGYIPTGSKGLVNKGATTPVCGDCRLQGGMNMQPAFWQ